MLSSQSRISTPTPVVQSKWLSHQIGYMVGGGIIGLLLAFLGKAILNMPALVAAGEKAPWYAIRSAGILAYTLLWLSTVWGLLLSTRWFPKSNAFLIAMHEFFSLLTLTFAFTHAVTLHFDSYLSFTWLEVFVPFLNTSYRPFALALGQVGLYMLVVIIGSFYIRQKIGVKRWRVLHGLTFLVYGLTLVHAVTAGTDTVWLPVQAFYLVTSSIVLLLSYARIYTIREHTKRKA